MIGEPARAAMREILDEVRSGAFARRWIDESANGGAAFRELRDRNRSHPIEAIGCRLRSRMAWLQEA